MGLSASYHHQRWFLTQISEIWFVFSSIIEVFTKNFCDFPILTAFSCPQTHFQAYIVILFRKQTLKTFIWWVSPGHTTLSAFFRRIFLKITFFKWFYSKKLETFGAHSFKKCGNRARAKRKFLWGCFLVLYTLPKPFVCISHRKVFPDPFIPFVIPHR